MPTSVIGTIMATNMLLKYGFCKKSLRKNATLTNWTLVVIYRYLFVKKKVFNMSELHFSEVTSYKIHV